MWNISFLRHPGRKISLHSVALFCLKSSWIGNIMCEPLYIANIAYNSALTTVYLATNLLKFALFRRERHQQHGWQPRNHRGIVRQIDALITNTCFLWSGIRQYLVVYLYILITTWCVSKIEHGFSIFESCSRLQSETTVSDVDCLLINIMARSLSFRLIKILAPISYKIKQLCPLKLDAQLFFIQSFLPSN